MIKLYHYKLILAMFSFKNNILMLEVKVPKTQILKKQLIILNLHHDFISNLFLKKIIKIKIIILSIKWINNNKKIKWIKNSNSKKRVEKKQKLKIKS